MSKLRAAALAVAAGSVLLVATPASATSFVLKVRGKDLNVVVTDCVAGSPAGTTCISWAIFAAQQRELSDGTVTRSTFLQLDKFRVRFTATGFTFKLTKSYTSDVVSLNIADDLSRGSGRGVVPAGTDDIDLSFSLVANAPADTTHSRVVQRFDDCRVIDRQRFASRTADGSATVDGRTFSTLVSTGAGFPSFIDRSAITTITRGDCPPAP